MPKRSPNFEPRIDRTPLNLQRLVRLIFSDAFPPGSRLVERDLAQRLGVSRVPVREGLQKLFSKAIIIRDRADYGLRLRDYTPAEVTNLHEYREAIEVAAVRAACHSRSTTDLVQLDLICDEMVRAAPEAPSPRWIELDWKFHHTIVEASQNERFINDFDLLMIECNYVFYQMPEQLMPSGSREHPLFSALVHGVIDAHRGIVRLLETRDTSAVIEAMRLHLSGLSNRVHRDYVKNQLKSQIFQTRAST